MSQSQRLLTHRAEHTHRELHWPQPLLISHIGWGWPLTHISHIQSEDTQLARREKNSHCINIFINRILIHCILTHTYITHWHWHSYTLLHYITTLHYTHDRLRLAEIHYFISWLLMTDAIDIVCIHINSYTHYTDIITIDDILLTLASHTLHWIHITHYAIDIADTEITENTGHIDYCLDVGH